MKKKKLEFYFFPQCPYCQIVEEALRVTGLEADVIYYDIHDDVHYKQKLIEMTGRQTVPCMVVDGKPMHESRDIAKWLHQYAKECQSGDSSGVMSGS